MARSGYVGGPASWAGLSRLAVMAGGRAGGAARGPGGLACGVAFSQRIFAAEKSVLFNDLVLLRIS